jgi:hypothetical protein
MSGKLVLLMATEFIGCDMAFLPPAPDVIHHRSTTELEHLRRRTLGFTGVISIGVARTDKQS